MTMHIDQGGIRVEASELSRLRTEAHEAERLRGEMARETERYAGLWATCDALRTERDDARRMEQYFDDENAAAWRALGVDCGEIPCVLHEAITRVRQERDALLARGDRYRARALALRRQCVGWRATSECFEDYWADTEREVDTVRAALVAQTQRAEAAERDRAELRAALDAATATIAAYPAPVAWAQALADRDAAQARVAALEAALASAHESLSDVMDSEENYRAIVQKVYRALLDAAMPDVVDSTEFDVLAWLRAHLSPAPAEPPPATDLPPIAAQAVGEPDPLDELIWTPEQIRADQQKWRLIHRYVSLKMRLPDPYPEDGPLPELPVAPPLPATGPVLHTATLPTCPDCGGLTEPVHDARYGWCPACGKTVHVRQEA